MTSTSSVTRILPQVRRIVLEERAKRDYPRLAIGLSWLTWQLGPHQTPGAVPLEWSRFTSGGLKSVRGHAQAALSILAREGIMYGRNRPESAVQSYEHGERDKYFRVRISKDEAARRVAKMK